MLSEQDEEPVITGVHEMNLMADVKSGHVTINLGEPVQYMVFDRWDAIRFADRLRDAANKLPEPDIH